MQLPKNPTTTNSWLLEKILQCKKAKCNQYLVVIINMATNEKGNPTNFWLQD
jgi:hypothetical protein